MKWLVIKHAWTINLVLCAVLIVSIGYTVRLARNTRKELKRAKDIVDECGLLRNKYYEWLTAMDEWEEEEF